jgi:hypothetical protein
MWRLMSHKPQIAYIRLYVTVGCFYKGRNWGRGALDCFARRQLHARLFNSVGQGRLQPMTYNVTNAVPRLPSDKDVK